MFQAHFNRIVTPQIKLIKGDNGRRVRELTVE